MAKLNVSTKRIQISKANSSMVLVLAAAAFVIAFSLVASRALLIKRSYQSRVISAKEKAVNQLQANIKAANTLTTAYKAFVQTSDNVIGGNPKGTGEKDGDNAKIILDALPSQYDFPALASSLEKVLATNNFTIDSITGVDDEIAQQKQTVSSPSPVEMPFTVAVSTDLNGAKNLMSLFQRSIRPIKVEKMQLSGSNSNLKMVVNAITYYQPEQTVNIQTEVIK
jgi:hypothetical protein